jgi:hypothetical protein
MVMVEKVCATIDIHPLPYNGRSVVGWIDRPSFV